MSKNKVSRRQFLNYTLTGVGGFMAASVLMPMVRFAIDPVLQPKEKSEDFILTDKKVDEITEVPVRVDFQYKQKDAWYESMVTESAWVYRDDSGNIVALSPKCKHLGCTVTWDSSEDYPNMFFCPCHDGVYEKNGKNVPGTPPRGPLDAFLTDEKDGFLMLGPKIPNPYVNN